MTILKYVMPFLVAGSVYASDKFTKHEQLALRTFDKIMYIKENPSLTPTQQDLMATRAVHAYIVDLAGKVTNDDKRIEPHELDYALSLLNGVSGNVADVYFGNKNGVVEPDDLNKMNENKKNNLGFKAFRNYEVTRALMRKIK